MAETIRLVDIRTEPLSVDEVLAAVADPRAGGTAVFIGTVRIDLVKVIDHATSPAQQAER